MATRAARSTEAPPAQAEPVARTAAEEQLVKDAAMAVSLVAASLLALKVLAASLQLYASLLPLAYWYGLSTCPPQSSFDAKRELRCVLRGDALPPDHPQKPKSGFQAFVAGAVAALQSELATLPGYEVEMTSLWGAAWWVTVRLPTSDLRCVWIGCNHRWYYWGSSRMEPERLPESATVTVGGTNIKFEFGKQD